MSFIFLVLNRTLCALSVLEMDLESGEKSECLNLSDEGFRDLPVCSGTMKPIVDLTSSSCLPSLTVIVAWKGTM